MSSRSGNGAFGIGLDDPGGVGLQRAVVLTPAHQAVATAREPRVDSQYEHAFVA